MVTEKMVEMNQIYSYRSASELSDDDSDDDDGRIPRRRNNRFISRFLLTSKLLFIEYCRLTVPPVSFRERGRRIPLPYKRNRERHEDFVDGPYEAEIKYCPLSLGIITCSIIELVLYFVNIAVFNEYNNEQHSNHTDPIINGPISKYLIYNPHRRHEAWRFISYMLTHADLAHVLTNVMAQIIFGLPLELIHRWWRVILIYLAGGLAGSMGSSLIAPNRYLVGASGGLYALMTAHIAVIIMNWSEMEYPLLNFLIIIAICACDLTRSIYIYITEPMTLTSFVGHFCGALTGILIGIGILRKLKSAQWKRVLWWICVITYLALICSGILLHVFHLKLFPKT